MSADRPNSGFPDLPTSMPDLNFPQGGGPGPGHPGWPGGHGHPQMMNQMQIPNSHSPFSPPPNSMNSMMPSPFDDPHMPPNSLNGMRHPMGPGGGGHPQGMPGMPHGMGMLPSGMNRVGNPGMPHGMIPGGMTMGMPPGGGGPHGGGKIYPPNQPMVFNPSNPNAPPIYPCGICHKEVHDNDQAILCESGCNFWFHRICTGLTEGAFLMLTKDVYAEWVCDKCLTTKNIPLVKMKP